MNVVYADQTLPQFWIYGADAIDPILLQGKELA